MGSGMREESGRIDYRQVPLRTVLLRAFAPFKSYQVVLPDWIAREPIFMDISATIPAGVANTQIPIMLQAFIVGTDGSAKS
jgi:uncharacterized protein (TIGR03435 family)